MATDPELTKTIRKNALTSGLILGAISFVLGLVSFYFITSAAGSFWTVIIGPMVIALILPLVIAVFITLDLRKKIGGYWTFKQAVSGIFIMFLLSYALSNVLTNFVFVPLIEPQMTEKVQAAVVDASSKMMTKSGMEQDKIDERVADMQKGFEEQKNATITKKAISIAGSIVLMFIISLIFAAIFKKEKPLFDAPIDAEA